MASSVIDSAEDAVQRQRSRTSWTQRADGANPTIDGLLAGAKHGVLYTAVALMVVGAATVNSPSFRAASSPVEWCCVHEASVFFSLNELSMSLAPRRLSLPCHSGRAQLRRRA